MEKLFFWLAFVLLVSCSNENAKKATLLNDKGVDLLDKEEYDKALDNFHAALKAGDLPNNLEAGIFRNICLAHNFLEQPDSAKFYAKKGYEIAEKDSYLYFVNKAEFDLQSNKVAEAIANYEKAKSIKSDEMIVFNSLGMIYSGSYGEEFVDHKKALENNKTAYQLAPREPLMEALATSYMNLDNYQESIAYWEKLIAMNPSKMDYHFQLGVALLFSGKEKEGEDKMQFAADRDENCRNMLNEMMAE